MIIGIDVGSSTTKIVFLENLKIVNTITTTSDDLEKTISDKGINKSQIGRIVLTGAGASKIKENIFGINTERVDEIRAIGLGGMFLSGLEKTTIANIGTGTAIIKTNGDKITHFGGTGVGGGTIFGLAKKMLNIAEFSEITELAKKGRLNQIDLLLGDITDTKISFLNPETTASNFGKMSDIATEADIALGIINLAYQVIGTLCAFASSEVVVTGKGSGNPVGQKVLGDISELYKVKFIFPDYGEHATALGACLK